MTALTKALIVAEHDNRVERQVVHRLTNNPEGRWVLSVSTDSESD